MKFGILVDSIETSQGGFFLCEELNKLCKKDDVSPYVFYNNYGRIPLLPMFMVAQSSNAWGFDGVLMSTDIETTKALIKIPSSHPKLFYIWDLEWLYKPRPYEEMLGVYCRDEIELVARNKTHYDIITKCWKEPKYILQDYDNETIVDEITANC